MGSELFEEKKAATEEATRNREGHLVQVARTRSDCRVDESFVFPDGIPIFHAEHYTTELPTQPDAEHRGAG